MSGYLIGVDVGTSAAKAVIVSSTGRQIAEHSVEHGLLMPAPLHAEQDADIWFDSLIGAVRGAIEKSKIDPKTIQGITVTSLYGGSGVPVDAGLKPLRPCIIWMDRRAQAECDFLIDNIAQSWLFEVTGNGVDPYYGFSKMLWIKNNEPELFAKIRYFLPPNAYFIARLTGEVAVDINSAGNIGGVFDIHKKQWSDALISMMGLPRHMFPNRLVNSNDVVGKLHDAGAAALGLPVGTPVIAGGIDAAVATLSAGITEAGQHAAMIGTSMCWGFLHHDEKLQPGLISMPYVLGGLTYSHGGAGTAGASIRWFRDNISAAHDLVRSPLADNDYTQDVYGLLAAQAKSIGAGSNGLIALPYFAGERSPVWDGNARGTITGLTLEHSNAHVYRAMLESVSYALRHAIDSVGSFATSLENGLPVVGGAAQSALWLQIIADVTGRPVRASASAGEAAFGGAALAALGLGMVDRAGLRNWILGGRQDDQVAPNHNNREIYDVAYGQYRDLYTVLKPYFLAQSRKQRSA